MISSLARWWQRRRERMAMRKLNTILDDATVGTIVAAVGTHIANRTQGYSTEADLPYPRMAIEMAFVKAIAQLLGRRSAAGGTEVCLYHSRRPVSHTR
jgi:hypothetical protein